MDGFDDLHGGELFPFSLIDYIRQYLEVFLKVLFKLRKNKQWEQILAHSIIVFKMF
jgi:hypothetical protein